MGMGKISKPAKPWTLELCVDQNFNLPSFTCVGVEQIYRNKVSIFY